MNLRMIKCIRAFVVTVAAGALSDILIVRDDL